MELKQLSKCRNYGIALVLGSGGFYFGYFLACFNPLFMPMLVGAFGYDETKDKSLLNTYNGLTTMFFCLGAASGTLLSGYLSDKFGRRPILYLGEVIALASGVPYLFENVGALFVGRYMSGLVAGVNSSMFSVIMAELLPNQICGFGNSFAYLVITFGILLSYLTQNIFSYGTIVKYWRIILLWPLVISVVRLALFPFFIRTDTPKYVYSSIRDKQAARDRVKAVMLTIYDAQDSEKATATVVALFNKQESAGPVSFLSLFRAKYRSRNLSGCSVAFFQQLSGIVFIVFYSTDLFNSFKQGSGKTLTLIVGISNFAGSILTIYLIGKMGRKFNLIAGIFFQGVAWFLLLIGFQVGALWLLIVGSCLYMVSFSVGLGGTETAYISEVLPPIGVGFALAVHWLLNAVIGILIPILVQSLGPSALMGFFGVVSILGVFALDFLLIETKGKSEETIIAEFENKKYRCFDIFRKGDEQKIQAPDRSQNPAMRSDTELQDIATNRKDGERAPFSKAEGS